MLIIQFLILILSFLVLIVFLVSYTPNPYTIIYLICTNISHILSVNYCSKTTMYALTKPQYT